MLNGIPPRVHSKELLESDVMAFSQREVLKSMSNSLIVKRQGAVSPPSSAPDADVRCRKKEDGKRSNHYGVFQISEVRISGDHFGRENSGCG